MKMSFALTVSHLANILEQLEELRRLSRSAQYDSQKTVPTEMRRTKIEHYCSPMESRTPPYGREPFLRM